MFVVITETAVEASDFPQSVEAAGGDPPDQATSQAKQRFFKNRGSAVI